MGMARGVDAFDDITIMSIPQVRVIFFHLNTKELNL